MLLDIFCFVSSLFYHITFWAECKRQHSYFHRIANTIITGAALANETLKKRTLSGISAGDVLLKSYPSSFEK